MRIGPQRPVNPDAIVAPQGYRVEALITGLSFPSAISFGPGGELYLAESGGVAGTTVATPRVLRIDPDRSVNEIGRLENPIVGLVYRNGELLIGEDGPTARILRVTAEGELQILVDGLPGGGDYGLSGLSLDASGALLFGIGTRTNSGVVGLDNAARGWVARNPEGADVAGADVNLSGVNYVTSQPSLRGTARVTTGGFKPLGERSERGETVRGSGRCGGAVYRLAAEVTERGSAEPERLAWGLRNPIGVACAPDGRLFATEGGMEERGSRPIAGAPDNLWEVRPNSYYGWPDFASGVSVTDSRFRLPGHPQPRRLLENAPQVAGLPVATFAPRSGVGRLDFSSSEAFGFVGDVLVALSGEWSGAAYASEDAPVGGHRVVRVDPRTGAVTDFLANRQGAPSSVGNSGGLERPFDVRFDPSGEVLYVVDLGEVQLSRELGLEPFGGTGVVWRITRIRSMVQVPERNRGRRGDRTEDAGTETETALTEPTAEDEAVEAAEIEEVTTETTESPAEEIGADADESGADAEATSEEPAAAPASDEEAAPTGDEEAVAVTEDEAAVPESEPDAAEEPAVEATDEAESAPAEEPAAEVASDEEPQQEAGEAVAPAEDEAPSEAPAEEPATEPEAEVEAELPPTPEGAHEPEVQPEPAPEEGAEPAEGEAQ